MIPQATKPKDVSREAGFILTLPLLKCYFVCSRGFLNGYLAMRQEHSTLIRTSILLSVCLLPPQYFSLIHLFILWAVSQKLAHYV